MQLMPREFFVPTTEQLLTGAAGFNLQTATNVQRACCNIGDGIPLREELKSDPNVVQMVGGHQRLAQLPSERGELPDVVVDISSIRSAKTMRALARSARASQIIDVSVLTYGERPRISFVSLKLDRSRAAFRLLKGLFGRPALKPLVIGETAESLLVRHPSGREVEIACVAGGRAAGGFIGDWSAGLIADEAPRMLGRDDSVTNLDDILTAVRGRMLPGAQIQLIGSPWAPTGPVYELVQQHWPKESVA